MIESKRKALAMAIFEENQNIFGNLYGRWLDEKDYEDINDYGKVLIKAIKEVEPSAELVKSNKRPFGIDYKLGGAVYRIYMKSTEYGFKRIA